MADKSSLSSISPLDDPNSPYYFHPSDHHSSVVVTPILTGVNYSSWSRAFLLALSILNKTSFLDGSINMPQSADPMHASWHRCNNLIVSWLLKSISPTIGSTVFYMTFAQQIWEKLKKRFAQPDVSRICHLQHLLYTIVQGERSVDEYFSELNSIWEELRSFRPGPICKCGNCNKDCFLEYAEVLQPDYVFKFLNGLNESYSEIKSQILVIKPFPSIDEVYNLVTREESQKNSIQYVPLVNEMLVMLVHSGGKGRGKGKIEVCSHSGKKGHAKEKCYRLIGFPKDFKFAKSKDSDAARGFRFGDINHPAANFVETGSNIEVRLTSDPEEQNNLQSLLNLSSGQIHNLLALANCPELCEKAKASAVDSGVPIRSVQTVHRSLENFSGKSLQPVSTSSWLCMYVSAG